MRWRPVLHDNVGQTVRCYFTKTASWYRQQPWDGKPENYRMVNLEVRPLFEPGTAVLSGRW
jgi:hypothetical protein